MLWYITEIRCRYISPSSQKPRRQCSSVLWTIALCLEKGVIRVTLLSMLPHFKDAEYYLRTLHLLQFYIAFANISLLLPKRMAISLQSWLFLNKWSYNTRTINDSIACVGLKSIGLSTLMSLLLTFEILVSLFELQSQAVLGWCWSVILKMDLWLLELINTTFSTHFLYCFICHYC